MKTVAALCLLATFVVVVYGADPRDGKWMESLDECKKKTLATEDDVKQFMQRKVPTTKGAACLLACTKKNLGIISADNKVNIDKLKEHLSGLKTANKDMYEKLVKIFEDCKAKETAEADECEAAKKFAECVIPKKELLMKN